MMLRHPECVYIAGIIEKYAFSFEKHFPDDSAFTALNLKSASGGNLTNFIIRLSNAMSIGHLETIATKETIFQVKAKYMVSYGGI